MLQWKRRIALKSKNDVAKRKRGLGRSRGGGIEKRECSVKKRGDNERRKKDSGC
jgi:hypothetical protein